MNHKQQAHRPKIAIIGAGWAGLSAAIELVQHANLTVFEASKQAGGRARSFGGDKAEFSFLDNGQHIMIGAYHGMQTMMKHIGLSEQEAFARLPLQWHIHDGLQFQTASLPNPYHLVWGLLRAKHVSLSQKIKIIRDMKSLQNRHASHLADISVEKWLIERQVSRKLVLQFWQPLVWGALNTPLETASLKILGNVLQDSVWANKANSDYLIPKKDLGSIMAIPCLHYLEQHGSKICLETRVARLENTADGKVMVNGDIFDAVVLAVAPYHAVSLMPSKTPQHIQTAYHQIHYHAITTVYLRYAETIRLPALMTGLAQGTAQWFINRNHLGIGKNEVAAVISVSEQYTSFNQDEWGKRIHLDLQHICPYIQQPIASRVITEKRATIASEVNRTLPDLAWLHHHKIYPAGDYLHPRYPATLEAAIQSGMTAANLCRMMLKTSS